MRFSRLCLWTIASVVAGFLGEAGAGDVVSGELGTKLDQAVLRRHLGQFWGAVGVAKDGRVLLAKGYGVANQALTPNSADTLFDIGSVTKQFTAAAILKLEMEGKLTVQDRAAMWVDDVPRENQGITIYHLLTHTSGISQKSVPFPKTDTGDAVAKAVLATGAGHAPGEVWEYSNAGYFALAAIIERASGQTYAAYLREHLFAPAGMVSTAVMGDPALDAARLADRATREGRTRGNAGAWPYPVVWGYQGAGGVVSSVTDMIAWDRALRGGAVLNDKAKETYFNEFRHRYACGWECEDSGQGKLVTHSGGVAGFATWYTRWLDNDAVIVVLTNERSDPHDMDRLLRRTLFASEGPALGVELNVGQYELNQFKGVSIGEGLSVTAEGLPGGVKVRVLDRARDKPVASMILSKEDGARIISGLTGAIDGKAADAKLGASACDMYTMPYTPAEGVVRLSGEDISCTVMPSMRESGGPNGAYVDERITLIVNDDANGFLPLMLRMDLAMARALREELMKAVGR